MRERQSIAGSAMDGTAITRQVSAGGGLGLRFLGTGNSSAVELGSSAAVLEEAGRPLLLIDCGPQTLGRYEGLYPQEPLPAAVFITHCHLDHVGGLEGLFFRSHFRPAGTPPVKLYVPSHLVELLQRRIADYPGNLAEGGANFWDAFQLVPVSGSFWHAGRQFSVVPVRHHAPLSAFGLALPGVFLYTGDTRPVPEVISHHACRGETVFHDCGAVANPAHTGVVELATSYRPDQLRRFVLYHYESAESAVLMRTRGYRVAEPGERIPLPGGMVTAAARVPGLDLVELCGSL